MFGLVVEGVALGKNLFLTLLLQISLTPWKLSMKEYLGSPNQNRGGLMIILVWAGKGGPIRKTKSYL